MTPVDAGAVIVAIIAALGAWAAQRSATRASRFNTETSGRLEAERNAYERARSFDVDTIARQGRELSELRDKNYRLETMLDHVKNRLKRLEDLYPEWERLLYERLNEPDDYE